MTNPARAQLRERLRVTTYTPALWATLSEDARYEEYIRVRELAVSLLGEPETPAANKEPRICTHCARGLMPFQLQSGTGRLWHRNEANQLFLCESSPPPQPAESPVSVGREESDNLSRIADVLAKRAVSREASESQLAFEIHEALKLAWQAALLAESPVSGGTEK